MSKPLVTFADPEVLLIEALEAAYAARAESYKPATISPNFPASALTTATHVQVELEAGGADDYPVTERAQVRITCYAGPGKRSNVKALASLTMALVYAYEGDEDAAGAHILAARSDVITDPDTKNFMVWFLVRLNLKATLLAS